MTPEKKTGTRRICFCLSRMASNQTDTGLFLSIPAAARELGVSIRRLTLAIDLRQVPAIVLGRRKVVPRAAIEKLARLD